MACPPSMCGSLFSAGADMDAFPGLSSNLSIAAIAANSDTLPLVTPNPTNEPLAAADAHTAANEGHALAVQLYCAAMKWGRLPAATEQQAAWAGDGDAAAGAAAVAGDAQQVLDVLLCAGGVSRAAQGGHPQPSDWSRLAAAARLFSAAMPQPAAATAPGEPSPLLLCLTDHVAALTAGILTPPDYAGGRWSAASMLQGLSHAAGQDAAATGSVPQLAACIDALVTLLTQLCSLTATSKCNTGVVDMDVAQQAAGAGDQATKTLAALLLACAHHAAEAEPHGSSSAAEAAQLQRRAQARLQAFLLSCLLHTAVTGRGSWLAAAVEQASRHGWLCPDAAACAVCSSLLSIAHQPTGAAGDHEPTAAIAVLLSAHAKSLQAACATPQPQQSKAAASPPTSPTAKQPQPTAATNPAANPTNPTNAPSDDDEHQFFAMTTEPVTHATAAVTSDPGQSQLDGWLGAVVKALPSWTLPQPATLALCERLAHAVSDQGTGGSAQPDTGCSGNDQGAGTGGQGEVQSHHALLAYALAWARAGQGKHATGREAGAQRQLTHAASGAHGGRLAACCLVLARHASAALGAGDAVGTSQTHGRKVAPMLHKLQRRVSAQPTSSIDTTTHDSYTGSGFLPTLLQVVSLLPNAVKVGASDQGGAGQAGSGSVEAVSSAVASLASALTLLATELPTMSDMGRVGGKRTGINGHAGMSKCNTLFSACAWPARY